MVWFWIFWICCQFWISIPHLSHPTMDWCPMALWEWWECTRRQPSSLFTCRVAAMHRLQEQQKYFLDLSGSYDIIRVFPAICSPLWRSQVVNHFERQNIFNPPYRPLDWIQVFHLSWGVPKAGRGWDFFGQRHVEQLSEAHCNRRRLSLWNWCVRSFYCLWSERISSISIHDLRQDAFINASSGLCPQLVPM